jgi:poly(3-hydroxybutyrate) depolymerase
MQPSALAFLLCALAAACRTESSSKEVTASVAPDAASAPALRAEQYFVDDVRRDAVAFVPDKPGPKPLVLLFDPSGNAGASVTRWLPAANAAGWIVASTALVRDGTPDESDAREMLALLRALEIDFEVDRTRVYTGGWSGGGCGAYLLAILNPEVFRGGFIQAAHIGSWRDRGLAGRVVRHDQRFYLFTRDEDFNRKGTLDLAKAMTAEGLDVALVERAGGHEGMRPDEVSAAIAWMSRP